MKKYLQLIVVLGGFFLVVFLKNAYGNESLPSVGNKINNSNNSVSTNNNSSPPPPSADSSSSQSTNPPQASGKYKDGTYTGDSVDAYYGFIQVQATIKNGLLTDVQFLDYPQDNRTSRFVNEQAMPLLKEEAISAQSANVDIVSGASDSSMAFRDSLASALNKAS